MILMEQQRELEETFIEEYEAAFLLKGKGKLKSATILFSKALFALIDYILFTKYQKLPKNHTERFRILEAKEEKIYIIVDEVWDKYTDTYSKPSLTESVHILEQAVKKIVKEHETTSQKIKETIATEKY